MEKFLHASPARIELLHIDFQRSTLQITAVFACDGRISTGYSKILFQPCFQSKKKCGFPKDAFRTEFSASRTSLLDLVAAMPYLRSHIGCPLLI